MLDRYLDINSIDPMYWGKCGWIFLNSIALTYRPEHKDKYKLFIEQLQYILPCRTCGDNLKRNLPELNDALESKEKFLIWLLKIRNEIYVEQKRPTKTLIDNYNEIFAIKYLYTQEVHIVFITIISVLVLLMLIYMFKIFKY
jgi:hypothetical protein